MTRIITTASTTTPSLQVRIGPNYSSKSCRRSALATWVLWGPSTKVETLSYLRTTSSTKLMWIYSGFTIRATIQTGKIIYLFRFFYLTSVINTNKCKQKLRLADRRTVVPCVQCTFSEPGYRACTIVSLEPCNHVWN